MSLEGKLFNPPIDVKLDVRGLDLDGGFGGT